MLIIKFPESHSIRPVEKGFIFMYNNCLQEQNRGLWAITLIWLVRCHLFLEIDTSFHLKISALKMLPLFKFDSCENYLYKLSICIFLYYVNTYTQWKTMFFIWNKFAFPLYMLRVKLKLTVRLFWRRIRKVHRQTARRTDRQSRTMGNQKNSLKPYMLMWAF